MGLFDKTNNDAEEIVSDQRSTIRNLEEKIQDLHHDHKKEVNDLVTDHQLELREIKKDHELEIKTFEFKLKNFENEEVLKLTKELNEAKQKIAVLEERTTQLDKIVDLNADIVDVKEIINSLIKKLPQIDLQKLT